MRLAGQEARHHIEIEQDHPSGRCHQHVVRLDVLVDSLLPVQRAHALGELPERAPQRRERRFGESGFARRSAALRPDVPGEGQASLDQLHREEAALPVYKELVKLDQIEIPDVAQRPELLLEVVNAVGLERWQRLEGDVLPRLLIVDVIDAAQLALSEQTGGAKPGRSRKIPPSRALSHAHRFVHAIRRKEDAPRRAYFTS